MTSYWQPYAEPKYTNNDTTNNNNTSTNSDAKASNETIAPALNNDGAAKFGDADADASAAIETGAAAGVATKAKAKAVKRADVNMPIHS